MLGLRNRNGPDFLSGQGLPTQQHSSKLFIEVFHLFFIYINLFHILSVHLLKCL